jgi:hypothetical protein
MSNTQFFDGQGPNPFGLVKLAGACIWFDLAVHVSLPASHLFSTVPDAAVSAPNRVGLDEGTY